LRGWRDSGDMASLRGRSDMSLSLRIAGALALAAILICSHPISGAAETQFHFPEPIAIQPNVQFWVNVFTEYSVRDFVIVDRDNVSQIYQVFHLPGDGEPTRDDIDWANAYLKSKYGDMLAKLGAGRLPETVDERHVAEMFKGKSLASYTEASQNLRVQEGLKENFRYGLLRSRYYLPTMERIFKSAGLPPELVTLAQVESGFQGGARSGAGAVGIWQFTRATGKQYLKIGRYRDERLNPVRETMAAAKLLRSNYDLLGDWPLAITAYNYGTGGVARAADECNGDYSTILKTYAGPHFGFAVKNYYAEFLAALQVHQHEEEFFPGIGDDEAPPPKPVSEVVAHPSSRHHSKKTSVHHVSAHSRHHHKKIQTAQS
jgi:membrane-bound lytic murein transglycosylase D